MQGTWKTRWAAVACSVLAALAMCAPATARAADTIPATDIINAQGDIKSDARLIKVINAPRSDQATHAEDDLYTFTFEADETQEDGVALKDVPEIKPLTLHGVEISDATNSNVDNGLMQAVVTANLSYILGMDNTAANKPYSDAGDRTLVTFPHAGAYTYLVSETNVAMNSGYICLESPAVYKLRILVTNDHTADTITGNTADSNKLLAAQVTVEEVTDDYGEDGEGKVDPTKPRLDDHKQKIFDPDASDPADPTTWGAAGDDSGLLVDGFTFGNRYIKGGGFIIEKKTEGDYADKTKYFNYTLTITDSRAQIGAAVTYSISGGKISTETPDDGLIRYAESNGPCFMWKANEDGSVNQQLVIKFSLKEGGTFIIDGLWGFPITVTDEEGNEVQTREHLANGLNSGTMFELTEEGEDHYTASAKVYSDEDAAYDATEPTPSTHGPAEEGAALNFIDYSGVNGTHTYVTNVFDDESVSPTGVFIDNLPYILMIGAPLAVFVVMFARRRRSSAMAA